MFIPTMLIYITVFYLSIVLYDFCMFMPSRYIANCYVPIFCDNISLEVSIMDEWGEVNLKLDEFLKEHHISRSSLSRNGQIHYKQLLKYCNNDMKKVDLSILARICKTIHCKIDDIIEYLPPEENNTKK